MTHAFPSAFVPLVRCTHDGAQLQSLPTNILDASVPGIVHGALRCTCCAATFPIDDGILSMMGTATPTGESAREMVLRDEEYALQDEAAMAEWGDEHNAMELQSCMEAVDATPGTLLLELGAGHGRYTMLLAPRCRGILAVDFSPGALQLLQRRLPGVANVAFVRADVGTLRVTPRAFDRVFSTLTSNLPTRELRDALYRLAATALDARGAFIISMHHLGLRERLQGVVKSGLYREGGIFRHYFTARESLAETRPHFASVQMQFVRIYLPFARRLRLPLVKTSRVAERIPGVRLLGEILLARAAHQAPPKPALYQRKRSWFALAMAFGFGYWALSAD